MSIKKKKLVALCIIISILLIVAIYLAMPKSEIIKDIDKYQKVISRDDHKSTLTLFPDEINNKKVKNFYYKHSKRMLFDSEELILECYYTDEEYNHIVYIYINGIEKDDIEFSTDYLPLGYKNYGECLESYCQ